MGTMMSEKYNRAVEIAKERARAYYEGTPEVSDKEFDKLVADIRGMEAMLPEMTRADSPTQTVGAPCSLDARKVKHPTRMLSLEAFRAGEQRALCMFFGGDNLPVVEVSPKVDGCALNAVYNHGKLQCAISRGNGEYGMDVTRLADISIDGLPKKVFCKELFEVRGELFLTRAAWKELSNEWKSCPYKTARDAVQASMRLPNAKNPLIGRLSFRAYGIGLHDYADAFSDAINVRQYLLGAGIEPMPVLVRTDKQVELCASLNKLARKRASWDYETDGVVVAMAGIGLRKERGETKHAPRWACAYKWGGGAA